LSNAVRIIDRFGFVGGLVLRVYVLQSLQEAAGDTMLLVQVDGALRCSITDGIAMGQVLRDDA